MRHRLIALAATLAVLAACSSDQAAQRRPTASANESHRVEQINTAGAPQNYR